MKKLFFIFAFFALIVACTDNESEGELSPNQHPKEPSISLDATTANFSSDGGNNTITFTSSEAWTAQAINSRADKWCSVNPTGGNAGDASIIVTAQPNDTPNDRYASIIIQAGNIQKTITVSQKQKDALTVTSSKFEVAASGGEVNIEVKANINFDYAIEESAQNWIKYEGTRSLKTSYLSFSVAENDNIEKREAKIHVTSGEFNEEITIYQEGAEPSIVISQNEYVVSADGETIAVEVKSNVDVSVELPADANWITENTTRGISTNTYYFDIATSEEYDQRTAEIVFTNKANNLSEVIVVKQMQKDAIVLAKNSYTVDSNGGKIVVEVGHNIDFDIEIASDWITKVDTRAFTTDAITFSIAENTSTDSREGSIIIKSGDSSLTQTINVEQKGSSHLTLAVSCSEEELLAHLEEVFGTNLKSVTQDENGCYNIILFEDSSIPQYAFKDCEWLKEVIIGNKVSSIEQGAFYNCKSLKSAIIGKGINIIGRVAFTGCHSLSSVAIHEGVTTLEKEAFSDCLSLESIIIPNSVTTVGDCIFYGCPKLSEIKGKFASEDNRCFIVYGVLNSFATGGLEFEEYTIPNSVTSLGNFSLCNSTVSTFIIPESVKSFGKCAFGNCLNLSTITIPESITTIGESVFSGCRNLTTVNIPNSVKSIEYYAFFGCYNLNITIPKTVERIYHSFHSAGEELIVNCEIPKMAFMGSTFSNVIIGDGVTTIGESAFGSSLKNISIPNSVTTIGNYAFSGCSVLTEITIPSSVTSIGGGAFTYCGGELTVNCDIPSNAFSLADFTKVIIGDGITSVGDSAFTRCRKLTDVTIPKSVTTIGNYAFNSCI